MTRSLVPSSSTDCERRLHSRGIPLYTRMRDAPPISTPLTFFLFFSPPLLSPFTHMNNMAAAAPQHPNMPAPEQERAQRSAGPSRRMTYKATNMSFLEMVEMVQILREEDYDGKHGPYEHPNKLKALIMDKVERRIFRKFGIRRSREQLQKRWSDLKLREQETMKRIQTEIRKSKYFFFTFKRALLKKKENISKMYRQAKQ